MAATYFMERLFRDLFQGQLVHCDTYEEERILRRLYDVARLPHSRSSIGKTCIMRLDMDQFEIAQFAYVCDVEALLKNPVEKARNLGVFIENILYPSQIEAIFRKHINDHLDHFDIMCILSPLIEDNTRSIGALTAAFERSEKKIDQRLSFAENAIEALNRSHPNGVEHGYSGYRNTPSKGPQW